LINTCGNLQVVGQVKSPHFEAVQLKEKSKRDFLFVTTGAVAALGVGAAMWPLIDQMNPAASVVPPETFDLSAIPEGSAILVKWGGKPWFIRHRSATEIAQDNLVDAGALKDTLAQNANLSVEALATEANRTLPGLPQFAMYSAICTHLGCVLENKASMTDKPLAYVCSCHTARFDSLGRVFSAPAPTNLPIPKLTVRDGRTLVLGSDLPRR
jgi:ubiquinol-cytochrome c reductase iron-sulfur subunit